jgi:hypothetical protein
MCGLTVDRTRLTEMYFVFKNIRTFVAEFQHNKILSIEFDMLYLNLDVVARNSR